jgi:hypothetical protein
MITAAHGLRDRHKIRMARSKAIAERLREQVSKKLDAEQAIASATESSSGFSHDLKEDTWNLDLDPEIDS